MQTSYIYSVSRVNALTQFLMSKTDVERLLVAEPGEDLQSALKETYLASYVVRVPNESVPLAIEQTLIDAKRMIHRIAPNGDMFRVLWVQYDIHNLRVCAKARARHISLEECKPFLSERGIYNPLQLHKNIENNTLDSLQPGWQKAFDDAVIVVANGEICKVDGIFDALYFETAKRIIDMHGDDFMRKYFSALVDLFNLKSRVRHLSNKVVDFTPKFVEGGSVSREHLETLESTLDAFSRLGGSDYWEDAVDFYKNTGNTTQIDARSAEYLLTLAKKASYDMFSSSSLVLYYLKCRQAAANIRTIVVGKNSGMSVDAIRTNLRMSYVND